MSGVDHVPGKSALARYIEEHAKASNHSYRDIAVMAGFTKASIIYMFINDEAKVPLDHVARLAGAIGCDAGHLFLLALERWFEPESFAKVRELFRAPLSKNEFEWLAAVQKASGEDDPELTPERAAKLVPVFLD
jgi:hypothetical protein